MLRTVNVNWNDDGWNVNANSVENPNRWNDGNQVFSRNCWFSPRLKVGEFLLANPFFQPPSCRPISSSFPIKSEYVSVGIILLSHASCTKNFTISSFVMALFNIGIFVFRWEIRKTECVFKYIKKSLFNSVSNSIPLDFRKITIDREPKTICLFRFENYLW